MLGRGGEAFADPAHRFQTQSWTLASNGLIQEQKLAGSSFSEAHLPGLPPPRAPLFTDSLPASSRVEKVGWDAPNHIPQASSGRQKAGKTANRGVHLKRSLFRQRAPVVFHMHAEFRTEHAAGCIDKLRLIQLQIKFKRSHWSCASMNEF